MANSDNKLKAYVRYDGQKKIVPGSLILRQDKPTVGNFVEIMPVNLCCGVTPTSTCDASNLNLETLLTNMNICYEQVTNLFPTITYFTDYSQEDGITSIGDGCDDMYDGGNLFNTNLTQTYNEARQDNVNFDESIPYTHTQDTNPNDCDYYNPPMDGQIVSGTGIFNTASTTCSKYFTNMYPGMFMLAATGMNVAQFGVYGNLGSDGNGTDYADLQSTNYPDWTVFLKTNSDDDNEDPDPSVTHIIIVYGDVNNIAQVIDSNGEYDDDVLVGLGPENTAVIWLTLATAAGENVIDIEQAVDIADKVLDIYTNGCAPCISTEWEYTVTAEDVANATGNTGEVITINVPNPLEVTAYDAFGGFYLSDCPSGNTGGGFAFNSGQIGTFTLCSVNEPYIWYYHNNAAVFITVTDILTPC